MQQASMMKSYICANVGYVTSGYTETIVVYLFGNIEKTYKLWKALAEMYKNSKYELGEI